MADWKLCQYCGEEIKMVAIKCKHCGSMLEEVSSVEKSILKNPETIIKHALYGKYEILEPIGTGGMATVYKAIQVSLNRTVALKVVHQNLVHDEEFIQRFLREAQISASLNHPNIINIYDVSSIGSVYYIAMEFLEGLDIQKMINREGAVQHQDALKWMKSIAMALNYIHEKGLIHRDIKSSNILITNEGRPVLMDFGIAHASDGTKLTQTGVIIGTPEYMSPEQARGQNLNFSSDLYSLGVVFYQCLTGEVPFKGDNPLTVIHSVIHDLPAAPENKNQKIPVWLDSIVLKLLEKDPTQRFGSGKELAKNLQVRIKPAARKGKLKAKKKDKKSHGLDPKILKKDTPQPKDVIVEKYNLLKWAIGIVSVFVLVFISLFEDKKIESKFELVNNLHQQQNGSIDTVLNNLHQQDSNVNAKSNSIAYPKYLPFTPGKKTNLKLTQGSSILFAFRPYDGISIEEINNYKIIIAGKDTIKINQRPDAQHTIAFGELNLLPGEYKWMVNVVTKSGDTIEGEIYRSLSVIDSPQVVSSNLTTSNTNVSNTKKSTAKDLSKPQEKSDTKKETNKELVSRSKNESFNKALKPLPRPKKYVSPAEGVSLSADKRLGSFQTGLVWVVFSDRENNKTYTTPNGKQLRNIFEFMYPFIVAEEQGKWVHIVKDFSFFGAEIERKGLSLNSYEHKFSDAAEDYGWIKKDNLLLWQKCITTRIGNFNKKGIILNSVEGLLKQDLKEGIGNELNFFMNPETTARSEITSKVYEILYIYKIDDINNSVLLGRANRILRANPFNSILGWMKLENITVWDTRIACEPNWDVQAATERRGGQTAKIFRTETQAFKYTGKPIWDQDPFENRNDGKWRRFPVLSPPNQNGVLRVSVLTEKKNIGLGSSSDLIYMPGYTKLYVEGQKYPLFNFVLLMSNQEMGNLLAVFDDLIDAHNRKGMKDVWLELLEKHVGDQFTPQEMGNMTMEEIDNKIFGLPGSSSVFKYKLKHLTNNNIIRDDAMFKYSMSLEMKRQDLTRIFNMKNYPYAFMSNDTKYFWIAQELLP